MYSIRFDFEDEQLQSVVVDDVPAGYSLAEIAEEMDLNLHHNCGMVCSCSTCHLYIVKGNEYLETKSERESEFIDQARMPMLNSRLGCMSVLLEGDGYIEVIIPDQTMLGS